MTPTDDRIDAATRIHEDLATFVRGLDGTGLRAQSGCSEWDVAQVLGHLGSGAEIGLTTLDAAAAGEAPSMDAAQPVWDRWNTLDPEGKAQNFTEWSGRLTDRYNAYNATEREEMRVKLPFLPEPVDLGTVLGLRLSELVHHDWDVRVAFDPQATLPAAGVAFVADDLAKWINFFGKPDALDGAKATIAVRTTDPTREFGVEIADGISVGTTPAAPSATLTLPLEAWLRLVAGRLAPAHTPDSVSVTGDVELDQLRRVFPGY